jgi:NAD(P)-dependent dehydrogenase (short-subunit alcohol dehydrogenase family)
MKVAVITGAASGIGLALSKIYLQENVRVVMADKEADRLHIEATKLQKEFPSQVLAIPCDVRKANEVEALASACVSAYQRVDLLYNNAGIIGRLAPVWELSATDLSLVMEINVYGMHHVIKAFMPTLLNQDFPSHVINMASFYALCAGSQVAAYSMSKHAVLALTESLYFDLKDRKKPIGVSVVFPSFTATGLLSEQSELSPLKESLQTLLSRSRPALDLAQHIVDAVRQKQFYILPDKEVKGYCEGRTDAILAQKEPHVHSIEQLLGSLMRRKNLA